MISVAAPGRRHGSGTHFCRGETRAGCPEGGRPTRVAGRLLASSAAVESRPQGSLRTPWWAYSAFFMGSQTLFGIYVLVVVLTDFHNYYADPYLSPFFSPVLPPATIGSFLVSPGVYIVWSPLLFRIR